MTKILLAGTTASLILLSLSGCVFESPPPPPPPGAPVAAYGPCCYAYSEYPPYYGYPYYGYYGPPAAVALSVGGGWHGDSHRWR